MDTWTDAELIAQGRKHAATIQRAQLELGRLCLLYAPIGDASVKTGVYTRVDEYAEKVGVDAGTMRNYRAVAHAWQQIDHKGIPFTTLKALAPVAYKQELVNLMTATQPPTQSGRWTAPAAIELARENGLWSHSDAPRDDHPVLGFVRRTMGGLARLSTQVDVDELDPGERAALAASLMELTSEISTLRERLTGHRRQRRAA